MDASSESEMSPRDSEAQNDEMMVLESILGADKFSFEKSIASGKILIDVDLADCFTIFETGIAGEKSDTVAYIKHLPPLVLYFTLPNAYPSQEKPVFTLSSVWLDRDSLSRLCRRLDHIWEENKRTEIIFQWITFLKENAMEYLKIQHHYDTNVTKRPLQRPVSNSISHLDSEEMETKEATSSCKMSDEGEGLSMGTPSSRASVQKRPTSPSSNNKEPVSSSQSSSIIAEATVPSGDEMPGTSKSSHRHKHITQFSTPKIFDVCAGFDRRGVPLEPSPPNSSNKCSFSVELSLTPEGKIKGITQIPGPSQRAKIKTAVPVSKPFDRRAVFDTRGVPLEPGSVRNFLVEYDLEAEQREFSRLTHSCDVCLTDKIGSEFIRLKCSHAFCKDCIEVGYTTHITEGAVDNIRCLAHQCPEVPSSAQVRAAVGEELFERYDGLLLKRALETMEDLTYCPRTQCMKPVIKEPEDTLASCLSCGYKFCGICKMVYHGVEPCRFKSEERKKLFEEYITADKEGKLSLEKMYGYKQIKLLVDTTLSEKWVAKETKPCPHCKVPIEKFEGCNKVTCLKCSSYFCWICSAQLDRANPYHHYNDPQSPCFNNLFENDRDGDNGEGSDSPWSDDDDDDDEAWPDDDDDEDEDDVKLEAPGPDHPRLMEVLEMLQRGGFIQ